MTDFLGDFGIPEPIAAYTAGLWSGLPDSENFWQTVAAAVELAGLGRWDADKLEDAAICWIRDHVDPAALENIRARKRKDRRPLRRPS